MSKHTPGPWVTMGRTGKGHDTHWDIKHRSKLVDGGVFVRVEVLHRTAEAIATGEANTRLICAAPDLLAACKSYVARYDKYATTSRKNKLVEAMRAAIAKAEGQ